ncbi:sigma-70 family RNA polymerase sigma factor [Aeoliella mucimassa]|uniref:RNA polymerase sigma factor n=1 Tax=Aeoliella mucimassa TaxID=2527972 RepID=A0A518APG9_9BACT|nr:sigma-70 family RNA polymerase sigma factor [Aeoliella mucimassa]QDU56601.1 RNA polymerase sigma factor [Aeoliella mucimassa]
MANSRSPSDPTPEAVFIQAMAKHQRYLHAFIKSLVPTYADADDILQETSLALWEKRDQYDSSRDFFPWACGVAHIQVLRHRRKAASDKLWFNDEVLDLLAEQMMEDTKLFEFRREALDLCIEKLPGADRKVVELRYQDNSSLSDLSQQLGSSSRTIQRTMVRVRHLLHRCISAKLREWQVA